MSLLMLALGLALADEPTCEAPRQRVDGEHCCFPGQGWYPGEADCRGAPKVCPPGQESFDTGCFDVDGMAGAAPKTAEDVLFGLGALVVTGPRKVRELGDAVGGITGPVRLCYQRAVLQDPSLAGTLTARFQVKASGRVKGAQISESTLGDAAVEECVVSALEAMRLGEAEGGVSVELRLLFETR